MTNLTNNPPKDLTTKQKLFCKEYLIDLNATGAAVRAGYSKNASGEMGYENLRKPQIQEYLKKQIEKRMESVEITTDYVLNNIKEIGERCMERIPVMVKDGKTWKQKQELVINSDGEPKEVGVWEFREIGALKAQELLGKYLSLFTDNINHKFDMSFAEIIKMLSGSNGNATNRNLISGRN